MISIEIDGKNKTIREVLSNSTNLINIVEGTLRFKGPTATEAIKIDFEKKYVAGTFTRNTS